MSVKYEQQSARGVRIYDDALAMAKGFSDIFDGREYVIVWMGSERAYDVEPRLPADRLGGYNVIAIVSTNSIQELNPGLG
jgi:hypothetical protein